MAQGIKHHHKSPTNCSVVPMKCALIPVLASVASALSLAGRVTGVPESILELYDPRHPVINGQNYPARFDVTLASKDSTIKGLVDKDYVFSFDHLVPGDYNLLIKSFDFDLSQEQLSVHVDDGDVITVTDQHNTSQVLGDDGLVLQFKGLKSFYIVSQSSIYQMILDSPFGFIFQNQLYTFIFTICVGVVLAPTILSFFNPELAESLNNGSYQEEVDKRVAAEEADRAERLLFEKANPPQPKGVRKRK